MTLWICFAFLSAAVIGAVLWPLVIDSARVEGGDDDAADIAVYRDQLAEIESDRERGLIDRAAADAARAELGRRIFVQTGGAKKYDDAPGERAGDGSTASERGNSPLVYVIALGLPLVSVGLYLFVGAPGLPGQPFPDREQKPKAQTDIERMVGEVERHLREEPRDGRGWDVVAPVYMRLGWFEDARIAFAHAIELNGPSVSRLRGLGRAAVRASGGEVNQEARTAFQSLLEADGANVEARLWLARAREQDGDVEGAIKAYKEMLSGVPVETKWRRLVEERIASLSAGEKPAAPLARRGSTDDTGTGAGKPGEGNDAMAAAAGMNAAQRAQFIAQMVDGLAARLKQDGSDFQGWVRLVRSYAVLGRSGDAKRALADARAAFSNDGARGRELDALEQTLGLGS